MKCDGCNNEVKVPAGARRVLCRDCVAKRDSKFEEVEQMKDPVLGTCERSACHAEIRLLGFRIWNNDGQEIPYRDYCGGCGRKIMEFNASHPFKLRCELLVPLMPHVSSEWSNYRVLVERFARYATAEQIEHYNIWHDFAEIQGTITAILEGKWEWLANAECKYVDIRLDTRGGKVRLHDRNGKIITPSQFAFQSDVGSNLARIGEMNDPDSCGSV